MNEELTTKDPVPEPVESVEDREAQQAAEDAAAAAATTTTTTTTTTTEESAKTDAAPTGEGEKESSPAPPPKPARPLSPFSQAQAQLKEAFPSVEESVIKAVLVASNGQLDPAFNALLSMSDPDFKPEIQPQAPPHVPPKPAQIEEDERLARQLAQEYNQRPAGAPPQTYSSNRVRRHHQQQQQQQHQQGYSGRYDERPPPQPERSFMDDDLPEIKRNLEAGFKETREKVTSWVDMMSKRLNGGEEPSGSGRSSFDRYDESSSPPPPQRRDSPQGYGYDQRRRRYDRDPAEISDDFQGISLRDDSENPPSKPPRPGAGVSAFGDSAVNSKWEPLKSSSNNADTDKDPFFIGESDDEEDEPVKKKQ